ncbi:hypothetical protein [Mesorhizobium japonicum]|uniref:hypothetical protein n=1 Tax=Mesorhizobium japonicum TaxID=2066070 RepID=UPI003B5B85B0
MVEPVRYETRTVQAIRGFEPRTKTKWVKDGWEFVQQDDSSPVSSKLTFRRPKKSTPPAVWIGLAAFMAVGIGGLAIAGALQSHDTPAPAAADTSDASAYQQTPTAESSPSTPPVEAGPTDTEVLAAFDTFFAERKAAGVMVGKAVTSVTYANRIVTVTFDPANAGVTTDMFTQLNAFPNLAKFAASPIAFDDDIGNRIRPVVDSIVTVRSDGTPLGTYTHADILALNGLSQ